MTWQKVVGMTVAWAVMALPSATSAQAPSESRPAAAPSASTPPVSTPPASTPPASAAPAAAPSSPAPASPSREAENRREQVEPRGIWIETKFRLGAMMTTSDLGLGLYMPGIVLGYKMNRMVVGVGVDVGGWQMDNEEGGSNQTDKMRLFGFILSPIIQYHMLQKGPVLLYAQAQMGYGIGRSKDSSGGYVEKSLMHILAINAAVGIRYFLHPRFAIGTEFGTLVQVMWIKEKETGEPDDKAEMVMGSVYGALSAAVVF